MYAQGQGVKQDYTKATSWYRKAAEQGDAGAQFNLGCMYANGTGVKQDFVEAARLFRKAAEQGLDGAKENAQRAEGMIRAQPQVAPASAPKRT